MPLLISLVSKIYINFKMDLNGNKITEPAMGSFIL